MNNNIEELSNRLKQRVAMAENLLILPISDSLVITGYYNGDELIDSVISINDDNGNWEIIEGEKSRTVSYMYLAYFGGLIDLIGDKVEADELFQNHLLD